MIPSQPLKYGSIRKLGSIKIIELTLPDSKSRSSHDTA